MSQPRGDETIADPPSPPSVGTPIQVGTAGSRVIDAVASLPTLADVDPGSHPPATVAYDSATRKESPEQPVLDLQEKIRRELAAAPVRTDDLLGQTIAGKFQIVAKLGAGGMGAVYRARQTDLGREVAVKVLLDDVASGDIQARRFTVEALAVSRLKHPNTIQIYDFGKTESGRLYIAMELLEGETLHARLGRGGRLPVRTALHILAQIAAALDEAHGKGIIHRDLKPENVFLVGVDGDPDFVKVLDFGVAKLRDGVGDGQGTLTKAGSIFGTPRYMSPEQASARAVDARSDLYSLGVMLFEMLTGVPPFDSEAPLTLLYAHVNDPVPALATVAPEAAVPRAVEALTLQLLEKLPAHRPESAAWLRERCLALRDELPAAFDALVDGPTAAQLGVAVADAATVHVEGLALPSGPVAPPPAPPPRRRPWVAAGATAAVLAGTAAWLATRPTPQATAPQAPATLAAVTAAADAAPPKPADAGVVRLRIATTPASAQVLLQAEGGGPPELLGQTPTALDRPRGTKLQLALHRDGYQPQQLTVVFDEAREVVVPLALATPVAADAGAAPLATPQVGAPRSPGAKPARPTAGKEVSRPAAGPAETTKPAAVKPKAPAGTMDDLM